MRPRLSTINAGKHLACFFMFLLQGFCPNLLPFRFALCGQVRGKGLGGVSFNASSPRLREEIILRQFHSQVSKNKARSLPTQCQTSDTVI